MFQDDLTSALKEAYIEAGDSIILETLEFRHADFTSPLRIVRNYEAITAQLEATAPLNPSTYVDFAPYAFNVKLPEMKEGTIPSLSIQVDNVYSLTEYFDTAAISTTTLEVTYRPYLNSDLSAPQIDPVITLDVFSISVTSDIVQLDAKFRPFMNMPFPGLFYTPDAFPTLT